MSYVHDDQHGSLLGRGVRDRAVLLGCSWAAEMSDEPIILSRCCPTCERLTAENAALRKDAERYRWLRGSTKRVVQTHIEACVRRERLQCSDQNAIDAAIDAAMEQSHDK